MGDQEEKWPELSSMLGELGAKLDRLIDAGMEKALPDYADGIVLSATAQMVQLHEGYRYNYLVVSSDAATAMGSSNTLTIDTPAIKYTQPIYEGINPLNIKGSSAKLSVSGLSGQYVAQFVETNESPLVKSAGLVKLTGNNAPLTANVPTLILSVPYSDFTASGTYTKNLDGVLSRNARERTFLYINTLNETVTKLAMAFFDSGIPDSYGHATEGWQDTGGIGSNFENVYTSDSGTNNDGILRTHVDSVFVSLTMGATAPTSGSLSIYVVELI